MVNGAIRERKKITGERERTQKGVKRRDKKIKAEIFRKAE